MGILCLLIIVVSCFGGSFAYPANPGIHNDSRPPFSTRNSSAAMSDSLFTFPIDRDGKPDLGFIPTLVSEMKFILEPKMCPLAPQANLEVDVQRDLMDDCVLWNTSCSGNWSAARKHFFTSTRFSLQKLECFRDDDCGQGDRDANATFASAKRFLESEQCANLSIPAGQTEGTLKVDCCDHCFMKASNMDIYHWKNPHSSPSCNVSISQRDAPLAEGATVTYNDLRCANETIWALETSIDGNKGSTRTAQLATIDDVVFKYPRCNPYNTSECFQPLLPNDSSNFTWSAPVTVSSAEIYTRNASLAITEPARISTSPYTIVSDGFTFTSPSIYAVIKGISIYDACSATSFASKLFSFSPGELSTLVKPYQTSEPEVVRPLNFDDLPCPPTSIMEENWYVPEPGNPYRPWVLVPDQLRTLFKRGSSCHPLALYLLDPPKTLNSEHELVSKEHSEAILRKEPVGFGGGILLPVVTTHNSIQSSTLMPIPSFSPRPIATSTSVSIEYSNESPVKSASKISQDTKSRDEGSSLLKPRESMLQYNRLLSAPKVTSNSKAVFSEPQLATMTPQNSQSIYRSAGEDPLLDNAVDSVPTTNVLVSPTFGQQTPPHQQGIPSFKSKNTEPRPTPIDIRPVGTAVTGAAPFNSALTTPTSVLLGTTDEFGVEVGLSSFSGIQINRQPHQASPVFFLPETRPAGVKSSDQIPPDRQPVNPISSSNSVSTKEIHHISLNSLESTESFDPPNMSTTKLPNGEKLAIPPPSQNGGMSVLRTTLLPGEKAVVTDAPVPDPPTRFVLPLDRDNSLIYNSHAAMISASSNLQDLAPTPTAGRDDLLRSRILNYKAFAVLPNGRGVSIAGTTLYPSQIASSIGGNAKPDMLISGTKVSLLGTSALIIEGSYTIVLPSPTSNSSGPLDALAASVPSSFEDIRNSNGYSGALIAPSASSTFTEQSSGEISGLHSDQIYISGMASTDVSNAIPAHAVAATQGPSSAATSFRMAYYGANWIRVFKGVLFQVAILWITL